MFALLRLLLPQKGRSWEQKNFIVQVGRGLSESASAWKWISSSQDPTARSLHSGDGHRQSGYSSCDERILYLATRITLWRLANKSNNKIDAFILSL
jgi:hypothetical protein